MTKPKKKPPAAPAQPEPVEVALSAADLEVDLPASTAFALFKSAMLWVSADECRPHLRQLYFEGDGKRVVLVTTNGHGMWICDELSEPREHKPFSLGLRLSDAQAIIRLIEQKRPSRKKPRRSFFTKPAPVVPEDRVVIRRVKGLTTAYVGRYTFGLSAPVDAFPPYRKVIDVTREAYQEFVGISSRYLGLVSKSLPGSTLAAGGDGVICRLGNKLDPCTFEGVVAGLKARVIVMPVRV